jgi:hypothetical protein
MKMVTESLDDIAFLVSVSGAEDAIDANKESPASPENS